MVSLEETQEVLFCRVRFADQEARQRRSRERGGHQELPGRGTTTVGGLFECLGSLGKNGKSQSVNGRRLSENNLSAEVQVYSALQRGASVVVCTSQSVLCHFFFLFYLPQVCCHTWVKGSSCVALQCPAEGDRVE